MQPMPEVTAPLETPTTIEAGPSNEVNKPPSTAPPSIVSPPTSAPASSSRFPPPLDLSVLEKTSKIVEGANGTIIIEELDTPAIRRAKNLKRKAEKRQEMLRRDSLAAASASAPESAIPPGSAGEPSRAPVKGGVDSELSSLSEFGSEVTEESGKAKPGRKRGRRRKSSAVALIAAPVKNEKEDLASVTLGEGEMLEGGTLGTWFSPAVMVDSNSRATWVL